MLEAYFLPLRALRRLLLALRSMRELARCSENPRVRMKSLFGPGSCQGSQSETALGCVVGSQALVISATVGLTIRETAGALPNKGKERRFAMCKTPRPFNQPKNLKRRARSGAPTSITLIYTNPLSYAIAPR